VFKCDLIVYVCRSILLNGDDNYNIVCLNEKSGTYMNLYGRHLFTNKSLATCISLLFYGCILVFIHIITRLSDNILSQI